MVFYSNGLDIKFKTNTVPTMISKTFCLIISLCIFFVAIGKARAAGDIEIVPTCLANNTRLIVFTLLNLKYTVYDNTSEKDVAKLDREQKTTRQIWKFDCSLKTSACSAAMITIDNVEQGQKLYMHDMILPDSIYITAHSKNVFTIIFGPFITFTVDIASGRVDYHESGPNIEGRGVSFCH